MSQHKPTKTEREIEKLLKATGLPYRMEERARHIMCFLGEATVGVISKGESQVKNPRGFRNMEATIKRIAKHNGIDPNRAVRGAH